jgi:hypothetical protein
VNNRWVNQYTLRYGVGTVVGAIILWYIYSEYHLELLGFDTALDKVASAAVLAAAGFGYCYIASAPLLVLHSARWLFFGKWWSATLSAVVLGGGLLYCGYRSGRWLFVAIMVVQTLALLVSLLGAGKLFDFYRDLAKARCKAQKSDSASTSTVSTGSELMESYRDLREHGNACAIVLFELFLGEIISARLAQVSIPDCSHEAAKVLAETIAVWVTPSFLILYVAATIEHRFMESER